jgi:hypothetical protein
MNPRHFGEALLVTCLTLSAQADIHYVDANGTNAIQPYADWSTAATQIQAAADVAADNDTHQKQHLGSCREHEFYG